LAAVKQNGLALMYASKELVNDKEFVTQALYLKEQQDNICN